MLSVHARGQLLWRMKQPLRNHRAKAPFNGGRCLVINVSEIVQLIEITAFLVEHISCSPDGIMEWWNIGILV
jgi:hypothetical protein